MAFESYRSLVPWHVCMWLCSMCQNMKWHALNMLWTCFKEGCIARGSGNHWSRRPRFACPWMSRLRSKMEAATLLLLSSAPYLAPYLASFSSLALCLALNSLLLSFYSVQFPLLLFLSLSFRFILIVNTKAKQCDIIRHVIHAWSWVLHWHHVFTDIMHLA